MMIQNPGNRILVIGDIMLDHYIYGDCNRISPEAPVPVVEVKTEVYSLGGAGNVLENLHAFDCHAEIICVVGNDKSANIVTEKLSDYSIAGKGLITDTSRCTTIKTRVLVANHQLIRMDREISKSISEELEKKVIDAIQQIIGSYHIVLISDYNKGLLTESLLKKIFLLCKQYNIKTIVDPKGLDFRKYKGASFIKPNKKEASLATGIKIDGTGTLEIVCRKIQEQTDCEGIVVTLSEDGMAFYTENKIEIIPTKALSVTDVTGAGDTVLASLGIKLASGQSLHDACVFANHAAAIVVGKVGSATATLQEIYDSYSAN